MHVRAIQEVVMIVLSGVFKQFQPSLTETPLD